MPRKLRKNRGKAILPVLHKKIDTYTCVNRQDGIHYSCEIGNGYMYRGHTDYNWLYTEIVKNCQYGLYRYYPKIKIITYQNDYTNYPVIYTQETIV